MRRLYTIFAFTVLFAGLADAQISSSAPWASANKDAQTLGTKPPPPPPSDSPTSAPIDGGLGILLVAGVAYGSRKYRNHKRAGVTAL